MSRIRLGAVIGLLVGLAGVAVVLRRPVIQAPRQGTPDVSTAARSAGASPTSGQPLPRQGSSTKGLPPRVSDLRHTALLGSVIAPVQAILSARAPARVREVLVKEGETVHAGQILVGLDITEALTQEQTALAGQEGARAQVNKASAGLSAQEIKGDTDVAAAKGGVTQAQARLQQALLGRQAAVDEQKADLRAAREGERKAQAALDHAQDTLRGLEELAKVGGVSRSDLEGARTQQRIAQSDLDSARGQVERVQAGPNGVPYRVAQAGRDVDAAQNALDQARDGVKSAQAARRQLIKVAEQDVHAAQAAFDQAVAGVNGARASAAQTHISSPIGGLVTAVSVRAGETAQPGAPLATVVSLAGLRVDALVPARLLSLFQVGQHAEVSADTTPGRMFGAVISEIARIAEPDGRTFRVKFRLLDSPPLRPGQTARISVNTGD